MFAKLKENISIQFYKSFFFFLTCKVALHKDFTYSVTYFAIEKIIS